MNNWRSLPAFTPSKRILSTAAFNLVELMMVMAITAVMMALIVSTNHGINSGIALTTAGARLEGEFTLARETALVRRCPVEVRFYDYTVLGRGAYRAMQLFVQNAQGNYIPLGKVVQLPTGIVISRDNTYSPLLQNCAPFLASPMPAIPNVGTSYSSCVFHFLPSGQTDLANAVPNPFLTLQSETLAAPQGGNFYTIQIDPINGKLNTYRP